MHTSGNSQNWTWRTRCRTCNSGQDAEPQDPKRQNTRQSWICRAWWPTHQTARVCNTQNWPWRTRCRTCNSGQDAEHGVLTHLSLPAELENAECKLLAGSSASAWPAVPVVHLAAQEGGAQDGPGAQGAGGAEEEVPGDQGGGGVKKAIPEDAEHGVPRHLSLLAELQNEECNH